MKRFLNLVIAVHGLLVSSTEAGTVFVEAESFESTGGWTVVSGRGAREASGLAMLGGAGGDRTGVATANVSIKDAGRYHVWVRYSSHPKWRGPFHVTALSGKRELGDGLFDARFEGRSARDTQVWRSFEVVLPEGEVTLKLSKHEDSNSGGLSRRVDCLLLTMDDDLIPNHLNYGAQTFVRVTLGEGHEQPAYIHIFADHFHAPWYQHFSLGRSGGVLKIAPGKGELLRHGERTAWCNLTPLIYQDSGAMLFITARHTYYEHAKRLRARFEFATAPDEKAIVRTIAADNEPAGMAVFLPPNLLTEENLALLKTGREIAEETGRIADNFNWPRHGKPRKEFPFFVSASMGRSTIPFANAVREREEKTLAYFGFTTGHHRHIGGAWQMLNKSYCQPDIEKMRKTFATHATQFKAEGGQTDDIVFCELTDEPTGQPLEFCAADPAYADRFRHWLKGKRLTPAALLVADWDSVRIVTAAQRDKFPALYYYSQQFRTRALGDFMAVQRRLAEEAYQGTFPVLVNFSDGAVYQANFYAQGVDYFELLDSPDQNAIWGEDWANLSSTYQCASFNVDLMRAAARERGQIIGHHLVAHANRKPWDIKLKATSELARGVKILNNFAYGPTWATHEGGPYWRSHVWQGRTNTWAANAALTREIGAVEDLLLTAMPAPAKVAILYSSASDIWAVGGNLAHGFERMHTWLALAHAQIPVDILAERQVARGMLDDYKVCYLSGPQLTRSAAAKLREWVLAGGTLWLTPGAATRDEFNRPLNMLDDLLPVRRGETVELQKHVSSGRSLATLRTKDQIQWNGGTAEVLSVKETLKPRDGATVVARFANGAPAIVKGKPGNGEIHCVAFLPALAYIKTALDHRNALEQKVTDGLPLSASEKAEAERLKRTANPWHYPAAIRNLILTPVRSAKIEPPITCNTPLVDAVYMPHERGILIPLANYTAAPIANLTLSLTSSRPALEVRSAVLGRIRFRQTGQRVDVEVPLAGNDFLAIYTR